MPVGRQRLAIHDAVVSKPPWVDSSTYQTLVNAPFSPCVRVLFLTPTAFSQGGDRHVPLPVPDPLLKSWHRRWNEFAPKHLGIPDECVEAALSRLVLSAVCINSQSVALEPSSRGRRPARMVGFTDSASMAALRPDEWRPDAARAFATLTAYSAYCGTGARTTQGFGVTTPLAAGERRPRAQARQHRPKAEAGS